MDELAENLSFERALERLEAVVRELESSDTGLDQLLARYEEGVELLKRCRTVLEEAERRVRLLTGVDAQGNPVTQEFEVTPSLERAAGAAEPAGRGQRSTGRAPRRAAPDPVGDGELF